MCVRRYGWLTEGRGGHRAAQYAEAFPDRVGNFVSDAAAPHGLVSRITNSKWNDQLIHLANL